MKDLTVVIALVSLSLGCAQEEPPRRESTYSRPAKPRVENKRTAENYLKIQKGTQRDEVDLILGRPDRIEEIIPGDKCYYYEGPGQAFIRIKFNGSRVANKFSRSLE